MIIHKIKLISKAKQLVKNMIENLCEIILKSYIDNLNLTNWHTKLTVQKIRVLGVKQRELRVTVETRSKHLF